MSGAIAIFDHLGEYTRAIEARIESYQLAEHSLGAESSDRQEVAVPATVLVRADEPPLRARDLGQLARLGRRVGEGLLHDDVLAGEQRAPRRPSALRPPVMSRVR